MRVRFIVVACLCCVAIAMQAARVSLEQAQRTASAFLRAHTSTAASISDLQAVTPTMHRVQGVDTPAPVCYIFNTTSAHVIVAADDRLPAVLGYSDRGTYDAASTPKALTDLLECYQWQLQHSTEPSPVITNAQGDIAPMLVTHWGQGAPFNMLCPTLPDGTQATTGSVATAMAQVLNYYQWPREMYEFIPAYISKDLAVEMPMIDYINFPEWKRMKPYYTAAEHSPESLAVSWLMLFCGQSVTTNYSSASRSSSALVPSALATYFSYLPTVQYLLRSNYTATQWTQLIINELKDGHPVIYRGQKLGGEGHSFVIDGYDSNGLFHINWGWHGQSDGYYALSQLAPAELGTDGYIMDAGMVTGIVPDYTLEDVDNPGILTFYNIAVPQTTYTRTNLSDPFSNVLVSGRFNNNTAFAADYDYGFMLYGPDGKMKGTVLNGTLSDLQPTYGAHHDWQLNISAISGDYELRPVSRLHGTNTWRPCHGADANYLKATIAGNTLTLTPMGHTAYDVQSATISQRREVGHHMDVTAQLTNTGSALQGYIYLLLDGDSQAVAVCDLQPGTTGAIELHCIPQVAGTHMLQLALDPSGNRVIYTTSVDIAASPDASLSFTDIVIDKVNEATHAIDGSKVLLTMQVSNALATTYNDDIVACLYRNSGNDEGSIVLRRPIGMQLGGKGSTSLQIDFDDIIINETYRVALYYYKSGKLVQGATTGFYKLMGEFQDGDVNIDHRIDVEDLNCLIDVVLGLQSAGFYEGHADVNLDGKVDVSDISIVIDIILGR